MQKYSIGDKLNTGRPSKTKFKLHHETSLSKSKCEEISGTPLAVFDFDSNDENLRSSFSNSMISKRKSRTLEKSGSENSGTSLDVFDFEEDTTESEFLHSSFRRRKTRPLDEYSSSDNSVKRPVSNKKVKRSEPQNTDIRSKKKEDKDYSKKLPNDCDAATLTEVDSFLNSSHRKEEKRMNDAGKTNSYSHVESDIVIDDGLAKTMDEKTDGPSSSTKVVDEKLSLICPVCDQLLSDELSLREKEVHINNCLDKKDNCTPCKDTAKEDELLAASLQKEIRGKSLASKVCKCGKDLTNMDFLNAQAHIHKCNTIDTPVTKDTGKRKKRNSRKKTKQEEKKKCPICLKVQFDDDAKFTSHLKQCAVKHKVATSKILCLLKGVHCSAESGSSKEKVKRKSKKKTVSNLQKYTSDVKKRVVEQMKQLQDVYQACNDIMSTPTLRKSNIGSFDHNDRSIGTEYKSVSPATDNNELDVEGTVECDNNIDLEMKGIYNTGSRLWTMTSVSLSNDISSLYLRKLHSDLHETINEPVGLVMNDHSEVQLEDTSCQSATVGVIETSDQIEMVQNEKIMDSKQNELSKCLDPNSGRKSATCTQLEELDILVNLNSSQENHGTQAEIECHLVSNVPNETLNELQKKSLDNLTGDFDLLLQSSFQSDFIFHCMDGIDLPAHSLILCLRCEYLKDVISGGTKEIDMRNVPAVAVGCVLKYLYTGLLPSYDNNIDHIHNLSRVLDLDFLRDFCTLQKPELLQQNDEDTCYDAENVVESFWKINSSREEECEDLVTSNGVVSKEDEVGNDSCFSDEELELMQEVFQTQARSSCADNLDYNAPEHSREPIHNDRCSGKEVIEGCLDDREEMEKGEVEENFKDQSIKEKTNDFLGNASDFTCDLDPDDQKNTMENISKADLILKEHDNLQKNDVDTATVLASDSETDLDDTLDIEPVHEDVHLGAKPALINDFNCDVECNTTLNYELVLDRNNGFDEPFDGMSGQIETNKSPCEVDVLNEEPVHDKEKVLLQQKQENCSSDVLQHEVLCNDDHKELFDEGQKNVSILESQSLLDSSDRMDDASQETLFKLNLTTHSPIPQSFGTPFLPSADEVMDVDDEDDHDTIVAPLDLAEATVIDEFAYEKLNNFLQDTQKYNDNVKDRLTKHSDNSVNNKMLESSQKNSTIINENDVDLVEDIDYGRNSKNELSNSTSNIQKDKHTKRSSVGVQEDMGIDFQISALDDEENDSLIILGNEVESPCIVNSNKSKTNSKNIVDLPKMNNRSSANKSNISDRFKDAKISNNTLSCKRNKVESSEESVSSGESKPYRRSYSKSGTKSKKVKGMTLSRSFTVNSSSDDNLSESDHTVYRSVLTQAPTNSRRSSGKKVIKTYSSSSPFVYKDNSWLSSKESPQKKSSSLQKVNSRKKKNNAFKEMVAKQNNPDTKDVTSSDDSVDEISDDDVQSEPSKQVSSSHRLKAKSSICYDQSDDVIDEIFGTTAALPKLTDSSSLSQRKDKSVDESNSVAEINDICETKNTANNSSSINHDNKDDKENEVDARKEIEDVHMSEMSSSQKGNDEIISNNNTFLPNESHDLDTYFMDDGGYNSFAMDMHTNVKTISNSQDVLTSVCDTNDKNHGNSNKDSPHDDQNNDDLPLNEQTVTPIGTFVDDKPADCLVESCNSPSINQALINLKTPLGNRSLNISTNSNNPELSRFVQQDQENDNLITTSTPVSDASSMTDEMKQSLIDACKNFRPGAFLHPETKEPITPMPDYSALPTPQLKDEMKRYALRNIPKHKMIAKMKEIYKYQHDFAHWEEEAKKPKAKRKGKEKENVAKAKSGADKVKKDAADVISGSSDTDVPSLNEKLMNYISSNEQLHLKVLTYQPLEFNDLYNILKSTEIKCSKKSLETFLDTQCICYYTAKDEVQIPKRKKGKKEKL